MTTSASPGLHWADTATGTHHVRLENTGETVNCKAGESLLAAIVRTGKKGIPVGCRGGGCGVCKVAVLSGDITTRPMSAARVSEDDQRHRRLLACCIYPAGDLVVCAIGRLADYLAHSLLLPSRKDVP